MYIRRLREISQLVGEHLDWHRWETAVCDHGITIDRRRGSLHPDHPSIIYPIDYGYVNDTLATDGDEIDLFCGTASTGLVGTMITQDHRRGDAEFKLIYNCSPEEIYLVNGFINFDRSLMEGVLVLRWEMASIWERL